MIAVESFYGGKFTLSTQLLSHLVLSINFKMIFPYQADKSRKSSVKKIKEDKEQSFISMSNSVYFLETNLKKDSRELSPLHDLFCHNIFT